MFTRLDTGQNVYHFLMDCGEACLYSIGKGLIQEIDHLFLSHCHMDHLCGFDGIFRHLYSRPRPFEIWGPSDFIFMMSCRFRSFAWNLVENKQGEMRVHQIMSNEIHCASFFCRESFSKKHPFPSQKFTGRIIEHPDYTVDCVILDHKIDSIAYLVSETNRININTDIMETMGLKAGKWCADLKNNALPDDTILAIEGKDYSIGMLRKKLLEMKKGGKIAYVTDFILNEKNHSKLIPFLEKADEVVMECSYRDSEIELAKKNYHITVTEAASLAKEAHVDRLTLFHISDRYHQKDRLEMLKDAQSIHPNTRFPPHWQVIP
ncbi:MAG: hypothetical protein JW774_11795 [Candidatus Aureabacteria bacterium]|nr:hypothetical protein [Candidatus Auribacterota bacterium]